MSGGTWNYIYSDIEKASKKLMDDPNPHRKAFGKHLHLVAEALYDIEWVDSCDKSPGDEIEAILKVISVRDVLGASLESAQQIVSELQDLIDKARKEVLS